MNVVKKYHTRLEGWPYNDIPWNSPYNINDLDHLRSLADLLATQVLHWEHMKPNEYSTWIKSAAANTYEAQHVVSSSSSGKRKRAVQVDDDDERPAQRQFVFVHEDAMI